MNKLMSNVLGRRSLLTGLAAATGTAILAACGGTDATATTASGAGAAGAATATRPAGAAGTTVATTGSGAATMPASAATTAGGAATTASTPATTGGSAVAATTTRPATTGSATAGATTAASPAAASSAVTGTSTGSMPAAVVVPTFGPVAGGAQVQITGAGSTFIFPMVSIWADTYNKAVPNIKVNYQSIGSGGGIQQFTQKTVDFGASDAPMTDDQLKAAPGTLHIPMIHGPVVATYNLKSLAGGKALQFSGQTLVDIYSGKITKWNDKALAADNPGVTLPNTDIAVVYRSDGSGTTSIWVDYLSKVSPDWEKTVGRGTSVKFPVGIGAKGNEGVSGQVLQIDGGIGYVELAYALQNKLPTSAVKNLAGSYVTPSPQSASAAAALTSYPADLRFSITQPPAENKDAYPITGTTWGLQFTEMPDLNRAQAFVAFVLYAIGTEGDKLAVMNNYTPIPPALKTATIAQLKKITVKGEPVLK